MPKCGSDCGKVSRPLCVVLGDVWINPEHFYHSLRYVGDMLAWLHQATASEKEHLEALLKQVTMQGVTH